MKRIFALPEGSNHGKDKHGALYVI